MSMSTQLRATTTADLKTFLSEWRTRWLARQPGLWLVVLITFTMTLLLLMNYMSQNGPVREDTARLISVFTNVVVLYCLAKIFGVFPLLHMLGASIKGWYYE